MNIIIDSREKDLIQFCSLLNKNTDISLNNSQLNLGDVIINNNIIIERKSLGITAYLETSKISQHHDSTRIYILTL